MTQRFQSYIDGQWVSGSSDAQDENPSDLAMPVGGYASLDAEQVGDAIAAAAASQRSWSLTTPQQRADALDLVGSEILARKEELGRLLATEEGKTLPESIGEAARAGQIFKFFAGEALRIPGEKLASTRPGVEVEITREPVGVVGIIAPWNFPLAIPAWKIAPALAYGNTVVFKPAEIVPGCAWALAEILSRAGLPAGVFNLVIGSGRVAGQALVEDPRIDALTFTGSVRTGHALLQQAAARGLKIQLEMGGKNPLVVLADADLDKAVEIAVNGAYFSTGQRCTASSRLIVEAPVYEEFITRTRTRLASLKIGHALASGIDIGPVASAEQLATDLSYLDIARQEGAELLCGGEQLDLDTRGHYLSPARAPDRTRGSIRTGGSGVACGRLRACTGPGQRHRVRPVRGHCHDIAEARDPFQAPRRGRHGHGQPADRRRGSARAVRWPQGLQLRAARAGSLCCGVLYDGQDRLYLGLGRPDTRCQEGVEENPS